ncbi:MAG TPA: hypothetical protein VFW40_10435 [Capsulimonadaceae bacterium]|nr:hypothetical protein [Capsulimonadaceae bacterium]
MRSIIALLKTIALEIWGLFVDDAAFALAVVAWIAIAGFAAHSLERAVWMPVVYFLGLALLLAVGAFRQARRLRK